MKKIIIMCVLSAMTMLTAHYAFAASECTVDAVSEPGKVKISGTLESGEANQRISIQLLPEDVNFNSWRDVADDAAWMQCDQIVSGAEGAFSTVIIPRAATGRYVAYIGAPDTELMIRKFTYAASADNTSALASLLAATGDETDFAQTAETNMLELMFANDYADNISRSVPYEWLRAYINGLNGDNDASNDITQYDGAEVAAQFELYCFIQALTESKITSLVSTMRRDYLSNTNIFDWYIKYKADTDAEAYIKGRMSGKSFASAEAFEKAFLESVVLYTVYKPNGAGNIKSILSQFESYTGIPVASIDESKYSTVSGTKYSDYGKLKEALIPPAAGNDNPPSGAPVSSSPVGFVSGTVVTTPQQKPLKTFEDLAGYDWAYEAIVSLASEGVISGVSETEYAPEANVTREQFVTMLVGITGLPMSAFEDIFDDVKENDYFAPSVITAYNNGLCSGVGDRLFGTGLDIKRQDMAVLLKNVLKNTKVDNVREAIVFADSNEISDYAKEAVDFMTQIGIMSGKGENRFDPMAPATRAEAAVVIYATMNLLK